MAYRPEERDDRNSSSQRPVRKPPQLGTARHRPGEEEYTQPRPRATAPAGRPVNPQPRPSGAAPRTGRNGNTPPRRDDRRPAHRQVQPRFFVILAVALLALILAIFAVVQLTRRPSGPAAPENTQAPVVATEQPTAPEESISPEETTSESGVLDVELAEMLAGDDAVETLDDSQRIRVDNLSINEDLPSEWMNVLLLGTDERQLSEKGRTDSIIICSVNTNTGEVKLSSVLRDLAIDYGAMGYDELGVHRVNAANYFGGPELAMKTINANFGLNIERYALINFYGFQDAVNAVGGITMDITEAEMNKINQAQKQVAGIAYREGMDVESWDNEELTEYGTAVHLNGQQALAYARIRKLDSDFKRAERQRKVLMAVLDEVKKRSALEIAQLGGTLMPYIQTNMTLDEILKVAVTVLASDKDVRAMRLPVDGSYLDEKRDGIQMLWDCDFTMNRQQLLNFIYYTN